MRSRSLAAFLFAFFAFFFVVVIAAGTVGCAPGPPQPFDSATARLGLMDGGGALAVSFSVDQPSTADACPVADADAAHLGDRALPLDSTGGRVDATLLTPGPFCAPITGGASFDDDAGLSGLFTFTDGDDELTAVAGAYGVRHDVSFVRDADAGAVKVGDTIVVHVAHAAELISNIGVQVDGGVFVPVEQNGDEGSFVVPDVEAGNVDVFVNGDIGEASVDCEGFVACTFNGSFFRTLHLNVTRD